MTISPLTPGLRLNIQLALRALLYRERQSGVGARQKPGTFLQVVPLRG
jgi:hypothetical protein